MSLASRSFGRDRLALDQHRRSPELANHSSQCRSRLFPQVQLDGNLVEVGGGADQLAMDVLVHLGDYHYRAPGAATQGGMQKTGPRPGFRHVSI